MPTDEDDLAEGLLHLASSGIIRIRLFQAESLTTLLADAFAGNVDARVHLHAINDFVEELAKRDRTSEPVRCSACHGVIDFLSRFQVGLAEPEDVEKQTCSIGFGVCEPCTKQDRATLLYRAVEVFREAYPNFRIINHEAGHA